MQYGLCAAFILRHLEQRSCELGLDQRWVFLAMINVGVFPTKLLELYDRLFKSRVSASFFSSSKISRFTHRVVDCHVPESMAGPIM